MTSEDSRFSFHSLAPEQTRSAGVALARVVPGDGIVLSLSGGLGAGKTQFVKGLAEGLGLDPSFVTSPTFAIVNEYRPQTGPQLIHMDFYRLESEMALEEVGFLDLLAQKAILAIEWGDRFSNALPADRLEIQLDRPAMPIAPICRAGVSVDLDDEKQTSQKNDENETNDEKSLREFRAIALGPLSRSALRAWRSTQPWESAPEPTQQ